MAENTEGQLDPEQPDIIEDNRAANAISSMLWVWKWVNRNTLNTTFNESSIFIKLANGEEKYVGGFLKTSSETITNTIKTYRFAYYGSSAQFVDPIRIVGSGLSFANDPKYKNIDKGFPADIAKSEKEKFYNALVAQLDGKRIPDEYSRFNGNPPTSYAISIKYFPLPTKKIESESPIKNFEDDDAFYINTEPTSYYLRFGALLDYIADEIIPKINTENPEYYSNPSMFGIDRDKYSNFMYSLPNQLSLDPRVCIVRNDSFQRVGGVGSAFPQLLPFRNLDYTTLADFINPNKGYMMNIYLNFEFIIDSLNSNADEKGDINVYNFLKTICDGLNKSLGGINNLEPIMDEETNTLRIIDTTPIPGVKENKKYTLQLYGYNKTGNGYISNFVRKVDLKTAITPEFATMVTVGATAGGYVKGTEGTAFSKWNAGLTDRFKENFIPGNESSYTTSGQVDEAVTNYTNKFLANAKHTTCYGYTGNLMSETEKNLKISSDIIEGNLSVVTEYYKYLIASQKDQQGGTIGFIPFKLSFTMDGLSGIKIYNVLNVDTRFLPKAYGDNLDLIVTGVSHRLSNNDWETDIETTIIPKTNQLTDMVISEETVAASIQQGVAASSSTGFTKSKVSESKKNIITKIVELAKKNGVTDRERLTCILAVAGGETQWNPGKSESFAYSLSRAREVFGSRIPKDKDTALKYIPTSKGGSGSQEKLANLLYGGRYENASNEGWKYRGRGMTQITFKGNYVNVQNKLVSKYFPEKGNIITNPDLVNDTDVSVAILVYGKINGFFGDKLVKGDKAYLSNPVRIQATQNGSNGKGKRRINSVTKNYESALYAVNNTPWVQELIN